MNPWALGWLATVSLACAQSPGNISGTVADTSGAFLAHASVKLSLNGRAPDLETETTDGGGFSFQDIVAGPYRISFTASGFASKTITGELHPAETVNLPLTILSVAPLQTEVSVTGNEATIAQDQIRLEETQRIFGLLPDYFVNYLPDAAPLNVRQKFELTWKTFLDPSAFVVAGAIAGVQQALNTHKGFGQGAQGYAKRYGASYADSVVSSTIERVVMPTFFKQDPRYFYKGTGTNRSRVLYALKRSVVCQGDDKKAHVCYSSLVSDFGSGFLTNYFYPAADRNSNSTVLANAAIGVGARAIANLFDEFLAKKIARGRH